MVPPVSPREFFIDRSLGRFEVAAGLRQRGWTVVTMAEHYGEATAQELADATWLADAQRLGWVILTKDSRLTRRQADGRPSIELAALISTGAVVICITNAQMRSSDQVELLHSYHDKIHHLAATLHGPAVFALNASGLREVPLIRRR